MTSAQSFSERHGYQGHDMPITIRNEAPPFLRNGVLAIAVKSGFQPKTIRSIICNVLNEMPDEAHNWGASNVMQECESLIAGCEWFEVYDICEELAKNNSYGDGTFEANLNKFFIKKGIGWKMEGGQLSVRGEADYEAVTREAQNHLEKSGRSTAADELKEGMRDLSRRPEADITGAIQHSMAALECLARDISDSKKTLGDLVKNKVIDLPAPIDGAVEKMWGFASEQGRHIREGRKPNFPEAILTVHFCSAIVVYLSHKKGM